MVLSSFSGAYSGIHQSGKGREDVDWGVYPLLVKLTRNNNLALCYVSGKVGYRVSDVVTRHRQDWELGY